MWNVSGTALMMAEGDFGIELPFSVSGTTLTPMDTLRFTFKDKVNGDIILEKEYTTEENSANLIFTEAESELFKAGNYVYSLDWYQSDVFMCNLVLSSVFRVVDKA